MTIKKFTGKTKEEAIALAKSQLGEGIVIMNVKDKKPEGIFGVFKKSVWEATVAIEEEEVSLSVPKSAQTSTFSVSADEEIDLFSNDIYKKKSFFPETKVSAVSAIPKSLPPLQEPVKMPLTEDDLKSTFKEISQVLEKARETEHLTGMSKSDSPIIKREDIEAKSIQNEPPKNTERVSSQRPESKPRQNNVAGTNNADSSKSASKNKNNLPLIRMIYGNLLENEVDEKYINEIIDDMGNIITQATSLDNLISNIYQKMVLKLGSPVTIDLSGKGPKVVYFIGPTGVGKTTTIAKVAAGFIVSQGKKVALATADTYRIGAKEQLSTYANYLNAPISVIYEPEDLNKSVDSFSDYDLVLVDTVGFSHKNEQQRDNTKELLEVLNPKYKKEVYLVLSATTKYQDLKEIVDSYTEFTDYNLVFTKLDETRAFGNILNIKLYTDASLSYITNGQTVPDDIAVMDSQKLVKGLLGG